MDLRDKIRPFIVHVIGNGNSISMWYDWWHTIGPLSRIIDNRTLYDARLESECTIADMISNNTRLAPSAALRAACCFSVIFFFFGGVILKEYKIICFVE